MRIHSKTSDLGRGFSIFIFLGNDPEDSDDWMFSKSFVGVHHVPTNSAANRCENCRATSGSIYEGFIYLNRHLLRNWPLWGVLDPKDLSSFLVDKLEWRVFDVHSLSIDSISH